MHRLVQEVARRSQHERQSKDAEPTSLVEALRWVNAAFAGNPVNPGDWPALEPLLPHARTVSAHADAEGAPEPTAQLMNLAGLMLYAKAQYAEAEPLMKRALNLSLSSLGNEHPNTRTVMENYVILLQIMGKAESEIIEVIGSLQHGST